MNRVFILFLALFASLSRVAPAQGPPDGLRVDLTLESGTLGEVANIVRVATGANIVFMDRDADLASRAVVLELTNVRWRTALELAVKQAGCVLDEDRYGIFMISSPDT